jgi:hypothetical protein
MSFLSLNCDKQFLYVIVYWVLEITFILIKRFEPDYFVVFEDSAKNEYILAFFATLSDLLSIILIIYTKITSKSSRIIKDKEGGGENEIKGKNTLIYVGIKPILKKNFLKKAILLSFNSFISRSFNWLSYAIYSLTNYEVKKIATYCGNDFVVTIDIIMRYIFSLFILKTVIYRHNFFSIIMIGTGAIILLISDFLVVQYSPISKLMGPTMIYCSIIVLRGFSIPLEHMLVKQIFENNHIFPAAMQFIRGSMELIIMIIITPILYFSFCSNTDLNPRNDTSVIIIMIFNMLKSFITSYIRLKIIYRFSIQSVSFLYISICLGGSIVKIYDYIIADERPVDYTFYVLFELIGTLIVLFATLVYDEEIIVKKWGLNENVKIGIIKRGEEEDKQTTIELDEETLIGTTDK